MPNQKNHLHHPFVYCVLSGTLGGQSLTLAKSVAELTKTTANGNLQFGQPLFYIFLFGMFFFIFTQIHFMNKALIVTIYT